MCAWRPCPRSAFNRYIIIGRRRHDHDATANAIPASQPASHGPIAAIYMRCDDVMPARRLRGMSRAPAAVVADGRDGTFRLQSVSVHFVLVFSRRHNGMCVCVCECSFVGGAGVEKRDRARIWAHVHARTHVRSHTLLARKDCK